MLYPQIGFGFDIGCSEERMTFVFACSRFISVPSLDRINHLNSVLEVHFACIGINLPSWPSGKAQH